MRMSKSDWYFPRDWLFFFLWQALPIVWGSIGVAVVVGTLCGGCRKEPHAVAFYFVQTESADLNDLARTDQVDLNDLELQDAPFLTDADILSYRWADHSMSIRPEAAGRLPTGQEVGVGGKRFVIVADGVRCYRAAFWSSISSCGYLHPAILADFYDPGSIVIHRAYPTGLGKGDMEAVVDDKGGKMVDPRDNKVLYKALRALGKLRE